MKNDPVLFGLHCLICFMITQIVIIRNDNQINFTTLAIAFIINIIVLAILNVPVGGNDDKQD